MARYVPPFSSPETFEQARTALLEQYKNSLGAMPTSCPLQPRTLEREDRGDYIREKLEYKVEPDEPPVSAYLLVPKTVELPRPGVVCLHQHGGQFALGKSEQVGRIGSNLQHVALELVRLGYVTMAADSRCFEQRMKYWDGDGVYAHSLLIHGRTLAGAFVWDIQRQIDYFCSRDEVDPQRIGIIGHSMGAMQAALVFPLEPRITVAVASQGAKLYEKMLQRGDGFPWVYQLPGFYQHADLDALYWLAAPRPLLLLGRLADKVSHEEDQREIETRVRSVYRLLAAEDKFDYLREDGGHAFSDSLRRHAYAWLNRWLQPRS
jgi:dienelactone hydrolase